MKINNIRTRALVCTALLTTAFVLVQLPLARLMMPHHPDERYYTDAALLMTQTGDYWTPRFYDGTPRPHKPILTYWAIAASYHAFGVSAITSRLPFIAAGAVLLWLTFALAAVVTRRYDVACLSAGLLVSQYTFLLCSNRTTPDIFMTVALTSGFLGLALQLRSPRPHTGPILLVLTASALAVMTKGLLGAVFLVYAGLVYRKSSNERWRWHHLALILWLLFIASWFLFMVWLYDARFITGFLYDQIIGRFIKDEWWNKPLNIIGYLVVIPGLFFPWWPCLLRPGGSRDRLRSLLTPPLSQAVTVALEWMLICAVIFGLGNKLTARYVLSAAPLLAILLASALASPAPAAGASDISPAQRAWPRGMPAAIAVIIAIAGVSVPATGGYSAQTLAPALALMLTFMITLALARLAPSGVAIPAAWSSLALAVLPLILLLMHVPFHNNIDHAIPGVIAGMQRNPGMRGPVICSLHPSVLSRACLHAGHLLPAIPVRDVKPDAIPDDVKACLISELHAHTPHATNFVTVATISLPVASSSEVTKVLRQQNVPFWNRLANLLRHGFPKIEYRLQVRAEAEDHDTGTGTCQPREEIASE